MEELKNHNWDFTLYELNGEKILTVVFYSSFVDISRNFMLNDEESGI
jgi:hypothetical protein